MAATGQGVARCRQGRSATGSRTSPPAVTNLRSAAKSSTSWAALARPAWGRDIRVIGAKVSCTEGIYFSEYLEFHPKVRNHGEGPF